MDDDLAAELKSGKITEQEASEEMHRRYQPTADPLERDCWDDDDLDEAMECPACGGSWLDRVQGRCAPV